VTNLGKPPKRVQFTDQVGVVAFSPDGKLLVAGRDYDAGFQLWNVATGELIADRKAHDDSVNAVVFSRDGRLFATGSDDGTARVWQANGGKPVETLGGGDTGSVNDVAFSPEADLVVTATDDETAVIWTVTGTRVHVLRGHTGEVDRATFDPDGKLVLTTSRDGTARVWDARTGATCAVLGRDPARIVSAQFVDSAGTVMTVSSDGAVRTQSPEACVLALEGELRDLARRFVSVLPADLRRELSTSSED
jgi:WD40 repeat protein